MMWSRKEICFVGCRILAILFLVFAIREIPNLYWKIQSAGQDKESSWKMYTWVSSLSMVLPAFLLWFFSDPLAGWMAGNLEGENESIINGRQEIRLRVPETKGLLHVGITVVGLLSIMKGLYNLIFQTVNYSVFMLGPLPKFSSSIRGTTKGSVIASMLTLLLGVVLLFFGRWLADGLTPESADPGVNNRDGDSGSSSKDPSDIDEIF